MGGQLAALGRLAERLEAAGLEYWVFGGWAVDLHAGEVTREHDDLDLAVWAADLPRLGAVLAADGWRPQPGDDVDGSAGYERSGVRLELAFLARGEAGEAYTPLADGGRAAWAPGAFGADVGRIDDVRARVIALRALCEEKSGPRDDPRAAAKDRADAARLRALLRGAAGA